MQLKNFYLIALLAVSGCIETANAIGTGSYGNRRGPWRRSVQNEEGLANLFDRFLWDNSYEGRNATGLVWIPEDGTAILDTTTVPSINQFTTGLSNLPSRFINRGMSPGTDHYTDPLFDWQQSNFHFRGVFDLNNASVSGDRVFRYEVGVAQYAEIILTSPTNIQFTVRNDIVGGTFTGSATGIPTGFLLVDWWVNAEDMGVYVNGVDHSPAKALAAVDFANNEDTITVLGPTTENGVYVFLGWRYGHVLPLATHQADATDLGL